MVKSKVKRQKSKIQVKMQKRHFAVSRIYTRMGDKGETGTFRGRMNKSEQLAVALGTIDELNSWIGVCREENQKSKIKSQNYNLKVKSFSLGGELRRVQGNLLRIGAILAGAPDKFTGIETRRLEKMIDRLSSDLPTLRNFIYPTGVGVAGYLQVARTVARRTEREIVLVVDPKSKSEENVLKYLNRLSDALFVMARWVNLELGGKEEVWK